jgi:hypothetical protein
MKKIWGELADFAVKLSNPHRWEAMIAMKRIYSKTRRERVRLRVSSLVEAGDIEGLRALASRHTTVSAVPYLRALSKMNWLNPEHVLAARALLT